MCWCWNVGSPGWAVTIRALFGCGATISAPAQRSEIATIDLPLTVENFEGIAVRPIPGGSAYVYLISDDNFHTLQRTLLLMFEYRG